MLYINKAQNLKQMKTLLSTSLFAPIEYYSHLVNKENIFIESQENYIRQSYRNRYNILSANGIIPLSVPVIKESTVKIKIKDVRISYDDNWQKQHLKTLESAYKSSPFYEFYIDDFITFFSSKPKYLFDLNCSVQDVILELLEVDKKINYTEVYADNIDKIYDYRNSISPKNKVSTYNAKKYIQVFDDKFDFVPNLSILDMLFNLGPESFSYLLENNI